MLKLARTLFLLVGLMGPLNAYGEPVSKPNIVHILTDDLGWQDVAAYYRAVHGKEPVYETPHMDRIAENGLRFMQAYSPSATCAPSRAAYMAGQYTPHTGVLHVMGSMPPRPHNQGSVFIDGHYPMRLDLTRPTIGRVLKEAGYLTAHIKKWHIGGRNNGYPAPVDYGFDFSWGGKDKDYNDPDVWDKEMKHKKEYWNGTWLPLNPRHTGFATSDPDDPFQTDPNDDDRPRDGVTELAVRWLDKAKDSDKPFFLNLCPSLVHGPISTRDRKRLEYYCEKMGVPFPTDSGRITEKEWDKQWGQVNPYYAAMVDGLDWGVGKVLAFLEETDDPRNPGNKLIDNTYLIVSADNGAAEGKFGTKERVADNSPLRRGKSTIYEGGIRVPVIMQGPGIRPGSVSDTPVNLIDLFPTFMDMADAKPTVDLDLDGCNIYPIMKGEQAEATFADGTVRDTIYFTLPTGGTSSSAIRKGGWKLLLNHAPEMNERPAVELFKLYHEDGSPADLSEKENLAETNPEKHDELLADLTAWLRKYDAQLPYKNPEVVPAKNTLPGADKVPAVGKLTERGNRLECHFETGGEKSRIVDAVLVYTTNGSDLLRESPHYEEWFRAPAEVGDGVATAVAPPGMTHGIFCLRDENNFLVRSRNVPPWHGPSGNTKWTIAQDPDDAFAWRPGLISLINTGDEARKKAKEAGLDTAALSDAMRTARATLQEPTNEESYAPAMRHLRQEIRVLDVPEAKRSVLNLFKTEKWSSHDPGAVTAAVAPTSTKSQLVQNLDAGKKQTLVTFGTSLTAVGAWVDQLSTVLEQHYPGQAKVVNGAQGGANSDWGHKSLDERVLKHNPDTVLIEFSVNDAVGKRQTTVEHARGNLENIIDRIQEANPACEIILMVMNPAVGHTGTKRPNLLAYNQMYRDVAKERGFQLIDHYPVWEKLLNEDPGTFLSYVPDTIHPVRIGALNVITPTMTKALGLKPGKPELSQDAPCWKYLSRGLMDENKDKVITRDEFQNYWATILGSSDADNDGQLTPNEFGPPVLFNHLDADSNGKITLEEFLKTYTPHFEARFRNPVTAKGNNSPHQAAKQALDSQRHHQVVGLRPAGQQPTFVEESLKAYNKRMQWFVDAQYGMFIHS